MKTRHINRRWSSEPAFTLIEVLVATFVFSIVLASLFGTWKVIARSTERALTLTSEAQRTRLALESLESALGAAQLFRANTPLYAFIVPDSGSFSAISFAATLPESFPGSGFFGGQRLRRLTLTVEPSPDGGNDLVLRQNPILAPPDTEMNTYPLVLARDVSLFQLEFWDRDAGEFVTEWPRTNQLPMAVRMTLGLGRAGRTATQPATLVARTVRLPDNFVPPELQGGPAAPPGSRVR